jgi:hypothetical protein
MSGFLFTDTLPVLPVEHPLCRSSPSEANRKPPVMNNKESFEERGTEVCVSAFTSCLYSAITVYAISQRRKGPREIISFIGLETAEMLT